MFRRNLSDFQKANVALVINQRSSLDIRLRLVCHLTRRNYESAMAFLTEGADTLDKNANLHNELRTRSRHVFQNIEINSCTEVVHVGDEQILLPLLNQLVQQSAALQCLED